MDFFFLTSYELMKFLEDTKYFFFKHAWKEKVNIVGLVFKKNEDQRNERLPM